MINSMSSRKRSSASNQSTTKIRKKAKRLKNDEDVSSQSSNDDSTDNSIAIMAILSQADRSSLSTLDTWTNLSTSGSLSKPSTSGTQLKPKLAGTEPKPSISGAQPKRSTSGTWPKPSKSDTRPKTSTSDTRSKTSASETRPKHSTSGAKSDHSTSGTRPKPSKTSYSVKGTAKELPTSRSEDSVNIIVQDRTVNNYGKIGNLSTGDNHTGDMVAKMDTQEINLRARTHKRFVKWAEGMIVTQGIRTALRKVSNGDKWITLTGCPGEGKTTAGYLILKQLDSEGRQVYDIQNPDDYNCVKDVDSPVLMFDDIFGSSRFDRKQFEMWEGVLRDLLALQEHKMSNKNTKDDDSRSPTVIFISRQFILKSAEHHLGRFRDLMLKEENIVDFSSLSEPACDRIDKKRIWEKYNIDIEWDIIDQQLLFPLQHGFPHCCRLYAGMKSQNRPSVKTFFSRPLQFLNQTMRSLIEDHETGPLLREMLRHDGTLNLRSTDNAEIRFSFSKVVKSLTGTYVTQDSGTVYFKHPSIYDSASYVLCEIDPLFVIQHCSLPFLNERVRLSDPNHEHTENQEVVTIGAQYRDEFLERLKKEFERSNLSDCLSHEEFRYKDFACSFMQCITPPTTPWTEGLRQVINKRDRNTKESFIFLMTKCASDSMQKYVCMNLNLSEKKKKDMLFGICKHNSVASMKYFQRKYGDFDVNMIDAKTDTTPLSRAVYFNSEEIVRMLVQAGADINMECADLPLHTACRGGYKNIAVFLLDNGADVNSLNSNDENGLFLAYENGHLEVFKLLLDRGGDYTTGLGSESGTLLHKACADGNMDAVNLLLENGAEIDCVDDDSETPLDKVDLGNVEVEDLLLSWGADPDPENLFGGSMSEYASLYYGYDGDC